jgi:mono/diheme cytochrome c family protein
MASLKSVPRIRRARAGLVIVVAASLGAHALGATVVQGAQTDSSSVERGRYLAMVAGCNDCHTPEYMESAGQVDEKLWLTGSSLGWHGPWGTTYPPNLRLVAGTLTEEQWVLDARTPRRPPMPWYALRDMTDADVKSIYRYLKHMGPAGQPAPAPLAPGQEPPEPVFRAPMPVSRTSDD